jgi:hypothetical protein
MLIQRPVSVAIFLFGGRYPGQGHQWFRPRNSFLGPFKLHQVGPQRRRDPAA